MMFEPLKKYAVFQGRSRRKEYWLFLLFNIIIGIIASLMRLNDFFTGLIGLILFLPGLAVGVRRLHDIDKSGWFILLALIPIVGNIILFIFFCFDGTVGENRFGADPKADERTF